MSTKVAQKLFHKKNDRFWHLYKICVRMWEIWANELLPNALKSGPKSNKSPNLVALVFLYFLKLIKTSFYFHHFRLLGFLFRKSLRAMMLCSIQKLILKTLLWGQLWGSNLGSNWHIGRALSSGLARRLAIKRSSVQILALDTRWFFHIYLLSNGPACITNVVDL